MLPAPGSRVLATPVWHSIEIVERDPEGKPVRNIKQGKALGDWGEQLAASHLEKQGLELLQRKLKTPVGECDLLAADGDELVFVEVKTRSDERFGPPELAVNREKREVLRKIARFELRKRDYKNCRFDVIAIRFNPLKSELKHFPDAFSGRE